MEEETKKQEAEKPKEVVKAKEIVKEIKNPAVNANGLKISKKYSMSICDMIRGKTTEKALEMLEEVLLFRRPVKMNNREIPHKHGKGMMAGRYPMTACREFIRLIKQLNSNAIVNEFPIEEGVIFCKANQGSRPYRRGGTRGKRTNITLILMPKPLKKKLNKEKRKKK